MLGLQIRELPGGHVVFGNSATEANRTVLHTQPQIGVPGVPAMDVSSPVR